MKQCTQNYMNTQQNQTFAPNGTLLSYSTRHFAQPTTHWCFIQSILIFYGVLYVENSAYKDRSSLQKYVQKHKYTVILLSFSKTNVSYIHAQHIVTVV